jgi:hypothetical protein
MLRQLHKQDIEGPLLPNFEGILNCWNGSSLIPRKELPQFTEKPAHEIVANYSPVDGSLEKGQTHD